VTDARFRDVLSSESQRPLVCVFGWAGANDKNLAKYSEIYQKAGCATLAYYLPTRFIFNQTGDTPHLALELFRGLERDQLMDRPIFFHLLSDTGRGNGPEDLSLTHFCIGIMTYQGMRAVMRDDGFGINTRGMVLDSCPGPIPKITLPRVSALLLVNWFCAVRDGMTQKEALGEVLK